MELSIGEKELKARNDELLTTNEEEKGSSKLTLFAGDLSLDSGFYCSEAQDRNI